MDANRYFSMKKLNVFDIMQNWKNVLSLWCSDPVCLSCSIRTCNVHKTYLLACTAYALQETILLVMLLMC